MSRSLSLVRKLAIVTTLATFLLISIGGFVRAAGAGLGCPDWPMCFGRWYPPTSVEQLPPDIDPELFNLAKAWIEYANRLVGVLIGFLILGTFIAAWRRAPARSGITGPVAASVILVAFQGWLGGRVVALELDPRIVSVHLFVALVIAALLLYATLNTYGGLARREEPRSVAEDRLARINLVTLVVATAQVTVGALVRGSLEIASRVEPAIARKDWILHAGLADFFHRKLALLLAVMIVVSFALARRLEPERKRLLGRLVHFNLGVTLAQILAGLGLAYLALPPALQVIHLTLGSWLVGGLFVQQVLHARERIRVGEKKQAGRERLGPA
jgi:cytochrome c oxidase assembly protein subunit 15